MIQLISPPRSIRLGFVALLFLGLATSFSSRAHAQETPFFMGSIWYEVEFTGPMAKDLEVNEPNTKALIHVKDNNYIVQLSGGRYPKTFMFVADSNYEYSMDTRNRIAYRYSLYADLNKQKGAKQVETKPTAQPTGKTVMVKNMSCDEYRLPIKDGYMLIYVDDAYRVDIAHYPKRPRSKANWLIPGLEGRIPLQTIKVLENIRIRQTYTKIQAREMKDSQFRIPPSFTVSGRDRRF